MTALEAAIEWRGRFLALADECAGADDVDGPVWAIVCLDAASIMETLREGLQRLLVDGADAGVVES